MEAWGGIVTTLIDRFAALASEAKWVSLAPLPLFPETRYDMEPSEIRAQLRDWIIEHAKAKPGASELDDQTPLLETGLLSSLDIVEFVLFIEELRGDEVDTDEIEPEVFTSIDTLVEGFFATAA